MPLALGYLWSWFLELHAARTSNGYSPNPIGYTEMQAWCLLSGNRLSRWELAALRALDLRYLQVIAKEQAEKQKKP